MPTTDPRIDAYIQRAAPFAQPILIHLRQLVHRAVPDVEETLKWSSPHFMYHGMFCGMAAFKQHCVFGFWNRALKLEPSHEAMGHFGRITSVDVIPADRVMLRYLRDAAELNRKGIKGPKTTKHPKQPLRVPADFKALLDKNTKAKAVFDGMSPSHRREYLEWITEAKKGETRAKRLKATIALLKEEKSRHWKYQPAKA